jgi:hypothetical protein
MNGLDVLLELIVAALAGTAVTLWWVNRGEK